MPTRATASLLPRNLPIILALLAGLALLLAPLSRAEAQPRTEDDADIELSTTHFGVHMGSSVATGVFGTVALVGGIQNFTLLQSQPQAFFLALTLTSLGAASLISSITGIEQNVRVWKALRGAFENASEAERRLLRDAEAARLKRVAVNRAIGLAADGTFFALGIVLMAVAPPELGLPLVLNGAFLLGLDIFRLIADDQIAKQWSERNRAADEGYFTSSEQGARRARPRILGFGGAPMLQPAAAGRPAGLGAAFGVVGVF